MTDNNKMSKDEKHKLISIYMERLRTNVLKVHNQLGIKIKSLNWDVEYEK